MYSSSILQLGNIEGVDVFFFEDDPEVLYTWQHLRYCKQVQLVDRKERPMTIVSEAMKTKLTSKVHELFDCELKPTDTKAIWYKEQ